MIAHNHFGYSLMPSSGAPKPTDTVMPSGWKLISLRNAKCEIGFATRVGTVGLEPSQRLGHLNKQVLLWAIEMTR